MISPGEGDKRGHFPKPGPSSEKVEETPSVSAGTRRAVSGMAGRTTVNLLSAWTVIWGSTNLLFLIVAASQGGISVLFVGSIPVVIALVALFWKRQHPVALMVSALPLTLLFTAMAMPGSHAPETAWQRQERERQKAEATGQVRDATSLQDQRTVERGQTPSLWHMPAVDCKMQAERMLKAPVTARFAPFGEWEVRKDRQDDNRAYLLAYVDAQNSFGALIRTRFICQAVRTPDGKWVLADVAFEK